MSSARKEVYKLPPTSSQAIRRAKALEEQKKKRHEKYDKARQLELFISQLSIANSDDEQSEAKPKKSKGNNKWASKCMYAEPLEMDENALSYDTDGLPSDLTQPGQWIAVAPVPVGKRCLAIIHQSPGPSGTLPNTTLRSRARGKTLLRPFPSHLPPNTILDCILDQNWRHNRTLHVLDVLRWKGQDTRGCEVPFRLWWRDTRLSEVVPMLPSHFYPTTFAPVPYYADITLPMLTQTIIPAARTAYHVSPPLEIVGENTEGDMDLDTRTPMQVQSDGILLYVAQATYEEGPSALAHWVSLGPLQEGSPSPIHTFEQLVRKRIESPNIPSGTEYGEESMEV